MFTGILTSIYIYRNFQNKRCFKFKQEADSFKISANMPYAPKNLKRLSEIT